MAKRLTIEQLVAMERLSGKQYTFAGTIRKRFRGRAESKKLGLPTDHIDWPELVRLWSLYPNQKKFR